MTDGSHEYRYNDTMQMMFAKQRELQEQAFGHDFDDMTDEDRVEYIRWNVLALTDELHEMLQETSWKPWAKSTYINAKAFDELIDAWHFLMNLFMATAPRHMEPYKVAATVVEKYRAKRQVNIDRQEQGYDGLSTKCPGCSRALDEPGGTGYEKRLMYDIEAQRSIYVFTCTACKTDVTDMVKPLL